MENAVLEPEIQTTEVTTTAIVVDSELLQSAIQDIESAKTLAELTALDEIVNELNLDLALTTEYKAAFDAAESRLKAPVAIPIANLPDDPEALKLIIAQLQAGSVRPKSDRPASQSRAGVLYSVNLSAVMPQKMPPQQAAIHGAICAVAKIEKKLVFNETEIDSIVEAARAAGRLGGKQQPLHLFRYYFGIKDTGFRALGFLAGGK